MGVFQKLKDIFYDEEIIEEEVPDEKPVVKEIKPKLSIFDNEKKKEEVKEEKPEINIPRFDEFTEEPIRPVRTERPVMREEDIKPKRDFEETRERELFQSRQTFNFPILNDDMEEEKPRTRSNVNVMEVERREREKRILDEMEDNRREENVPFKPSPVISPVYGILDKNFKKEDIVARTRQREVPRTRNTTSIAYDTVRKKAYGERERELERTKELEAKRILDEVENIEKELDKTIEEKENHIGISDIQKKDDRITIGEMEEKSRTIEVVEDMLEDTRELKIEETSRIEKYKKDKEEKKKMSDIGDQTLEHDLFNLIDSMYEDEEA